MFGIGLQEVLLLVVVGIVLFLVFRKQSLKMFLMKLSAERNVEKIIEESDRSNIHKQTPEYKQIQDKPTAPTWRRASLYASFIAISTGMGVYLRNDYHAEESLLRTLSFMTGIVTFIVVFIVSYILIKLFSKS